MNFTREQIKLINTTIVNHPYQLTSILFLFLLIPFLAQAQITEEEINREKLFIEANREKLLGNFDKAIIMLRELHRQDSKNAGICYELGRLYQAEGNTEEAIRFLKSATDLDAENEWYPKFLADIYQKEGRNEEGAELYEKLIKQSPGDQYLYFKQAYFLVRAQEIDKALKIYEDLEKEVGYNEEIARRRHTLYMGMGDMRKAERELILLTETYPNRLEFLQLLASFQETQGKHDEAKLVYQKIIELSPNDPKALLALSGGSNAQNDELEYMAALRPVFERLDVEVDLKISKLFPFITKVADTGNKEIANAAIELTDILEEVHGSNAKVYAAAADLYYHSGQLKEAAIKYQATIDRDKSVFPVWMQLLVTHYELGDFENLASTSNDALDIYPNRAILQYYLAIAEDAKKNFDNALDALSLANLMAGKDTNLQAEIKALEGQIYHHKNNEAKALTSFQAAQKLSSNAPEVSFRYGQYLLETGDLKQAKNEARKAAAAVDFNPYYTFGWAKALYAGSDFSDAEEQINLALKAGAKYWPQGLELAGDIQFQLKNIDPAVKLWQQAREISGPSEQLDNKIANRSL